MPSQAIEPSEPSIVEIRKTLIRNGYRPIPVKGKGPIIKGWQRLQMQDSQVEGYTRKYGDHLNTGLICGTVVAIDIDTPDADTAAHLSALANGLPGAERALQRVGKAPKITFVFRAKTARKKVATGKYTIDGHACQVEVLGDGQQFVAFGTHPDTGREYAWLTASPLDVPFADLPEIDIDTIDAFLASAEAFLAQHGQAISKPKTEKQIAVVSGDSPWDRVNAAAFANLDAWVPHLRLDGLKRYQDGYLAVASFRPSKRAGLATKDRKEALEIQPIGICDHGDGDKGYGPISLVAMCSGYENKEALQWLCEKLRRPPADFGWEDPQTMPWMTLGSLSKPLPKASNDNTPLDDDDDDDIADAGALGSDHAFPAHLCYPPGAVGRFARFIESCSRFPSPHLSLAAALALTAGLIGRRYKGPTGLRSNLYIIGLAESGFGKDITIRATAALADSTSAGTSVSATLFMDEIRSVPGLAGRLRKSPSAIAVVDEFGKWLGAHTSKNAPGYKEEIVAALLALTGAPSGFWGGQEKGAGNIPRIVAPCFSMHGVSTPTTFWQALSSGNIAEGLLGRFVLIDAGRSEPKKVRRPLGSLDDIPADLTDEVHALLGGGGGRFGGGGFYAVNAISDVKPFPVMAVEYAEGVEDLFEDFDDSMRGRKKDFAAEYRPLLNRVGENAARLALIVAAGVNPKEPVITKEIQEWANTVAERSFLTIVAGAADNVADNERSGEYLRVKRMIRKASVKGITGKSIAKGLRGSLEKRRLDDIIDLLKISGEVCLARVKAESGQTMNRYWSKENLPDNAEILP